jgi:hypothetical protein
LLSALWLIEGLPGSGKSATAALLCEEARIQGLPARWWLEEAKDHPVIPADLRRAANQADFSQRCIDAFARFSAEEQGVAILEGAAFQSVVRLLYANLLPPEEIRDHVTRWATALPDSTRLLFLNVMDPAAHFERFVCPLRGPDWTTKLIAYAERTPLSQARGWSGFEGLVRFWAGYGDLCRTILPLLPWRYVHVDAEPAVATGLSGEVAGFFGVSTFSAAGPGRR